MHLFMQVTIAKGKLPEHLLGVILDTSLSFKAHIISFFKKVNQKLHALSCIVKLFSYGITKYYSITMKYRKRTVTSYM